ncbi:hypothetical protein WBS43_24130 [Bacillus luti]|uniref:Uncharacterized protein n=1 Tax=Bacillus luti TaxID=2026191 RepID=A0ABU8HYC7_9BACI
MSIFIGTGLIFLWDIVTSPGGYAGVFVSMLLINAFGYLLLKNRVNKKQNTKISVAAFLIALVPIFILYNY